MRSPKDIAKIFEVGCNSRRDATPRAAAGCCAARSLLLPMVLPFVLLPLSAMGQASPALKLKTRIPLPHVNGRMDHLGVDIQGQRLFATAFDNHTVEVIDLKGGKLVQTISNLAEPQGALYDSPANRLFISSSADGTVKIYDGTNFNMLKTVRFSSDADNLRYDARSNRVIVGYGGEKFLHGKPVPGHHGDGALGFLDSAGKTAGKIAVDAHPESFQLEKSGTRVFVNVPDHKEVDVADMVKKKVLKHWPVTICTDNFPMSLDEAHHRLFVGCRTPALLLVFDTESGKAVASLPTVEHTDDLFYDAGKGRIYVLGEGYIDAWQQKDPDHYYRIGRYPTPAGAHTGLFVPEWGKLFVSVPHRNQRGAEILVYETR